MSELGSIFDHAPAASEGGKGPDLRVKATVRQSDLQGHPLLVSVPDRVPYEGGSVPRHREVGEPPGEVTLHLSPSLGSGTVLRLRRQGGEHPGSGAPGDLLVELTIVPDPKAPWTAIAVVAAVVASAAAAAAVALGWLG